MHGYTGASLKDQAWLQEAFAVQPPLSMISSCIQEGKLSLRLMKVRSSPMAPPCTVQVSVHLPYSFQRVIITRFMADKGLKRQ